MLREETKRLTTLPVPGCARVFGADRRSCRDRSEAVHRWDGRHTGRFRPRTQPPGPHQKEPVEGGQLPEEVVFAGVRGDAPRVALLPGARKD
jgi:hypothetical protein